MRSVNIKLKLSHFMMRIMRMSYSLLIENDEIICLTNLMSDMSETTNNVNVTEILNFKENKCISDELQTLR